MMISTPLLTLLLLLCSIDTTTAQEWIWVTGGGPASSGTAVSHDPVKNVYPVGNFSGTATFGGQTRTSRGGQDIFVAKYAEDGAVVWARGFGGKGLDEARAVEVDGFGKTYVGGAFSDTASFNGLDPVSRGGEDLFFGVFDSEGEVQWLVNGGGTGLDRVNALTIDLQGDVYLTGVFSGSITLVDTTITSIGNSDLFVAWYDPSGARKGFWHWGATGGYAEGTTIFRRFNGDLYVGGNFTGSLTVDATTLVDTSGKGDGVVMRLSAAGATVWARAFGGPGADHVASLVSAADEVTVTGGFEQTLWQDTVSLSSAGGQDVFLARFNTAGALQWARRAGGAGDDSVASIRYDLYLNSFISGSFSATAGFSDTSLTAAGGSDIFIAKYEPSGELVWAHRAGGTGADAVRGLEVDHRGVLLTGFYSGESRFGSITVQGGNRNFFVAKFTDVREISSVATPNIACAGGQLVLIFESTGLFASGNVFTAQLSDSNGSFANPVLVGQQSSDEIQNVEVTIPSTITPGSGYRLRVVSTDPQRTSPDNGEDITIYPAPIPVITADGPTTFCEGTTVTLSAPEGYSAYLWSTFKTSRTITVNYAGEFSVVVTGDHGCQGRSQTITLTQLPAPAQPVVTQTGNLLQTDAIATGYQWNLNGSPINDAIASRYQAEQSGVYTVTITGANGCSSTSEPLSVTIASVNEPEAEGRVRLLPYSSFDEQLTIELDLPDALVLHLRMFNTLGQEVRQPMEFANRENRISINVRDLSPGLYVISVEGDGRFWLQAKVVLW